MGWKTCEEHIKDFNWERFFGDISQEIKRLNQFREKHLRKLFLQEFRVPLGCHANCDVLSRVSMPSCGDCYAIFDYYFNGKRFAREFQRDSGKWTFDLYIVKTYPEEFIPTKIDNYETTGRKSLYDKQSRSQVYLPSVP